MSKHRKERSFRGFLSRNGFYIALVVCVIAAAIASYTAVSNILSNLREENNVIQKQPAPDPVVEPEITESDVEPETPPVVDHNAEPDSSVTSSADQLVPIYQLPVVGTITNAWSGEELVRSVTMNDWRTHNGVDYACDEGAAVTAIYSGEITRTGFDPLLGNFVEQKLDTGYTVLYANLANSIAVKAGDRISQSDLLGYVGSSAILENGEVPHLHFEVRNGDNYIDPQSLF